MSTMKTVHFEEVKDVMEQMLRAPIFETPEKRMLATLSKKMLDPNLVMDVRHKIFHEPLSLSPSKDVILQEAKRLILNEETQALYRRQEENMLESELKRFQSHLQKSRPKFRGPYICSRKIMANSNDHQFWAGLTGIAKKEIEILSDTVTEIESSGRIAPQTEQSAKLEVSNYHCPIVVTIKDKPITESKEDRLELMRRAFKALRRNVVQERQLQDLRIKVQERITTQRLQHTFHTWRTFVDNARNRAQLKKDGKEMSKERKIELFVNAISEKQKELAKLQNKTNSADVSATLRRTQSADHPINPISVKKNSAKTVTVVDPPAKHRLNAQRRIIAEQKAKLAEQNRIIEDLKLKQIEKETQRASQDTVNVAKEVLAHVGGRTRRTLIKLIRDEGCKDKSIIEPPRLPSPPKFLIRMEARAEARRERVKRAQEEREKKMEEKRKKEESERRAEDEERKRLQLEAQKEARRLREEQEQRRAREAERTKQLNQIADEFRRKYLLRRYMMEPFFRLIDTKYNYIKIADDHYQGSLLRRTLGIWLKETHERISVKMDLASAVYNRNILWYVFRDWRDFTRSEAKKMQVATDFHDMRLQEKCLRAWNAKTVESKVQTLNDEQLAREHYGKRLRAKYFARWKDYPTIAWDMKEKEKRKDKWRELVQRVIPDFDPKQRGVAIED
ncbi:calponin homology domain-containing protein DDB_G0272472 [Neodiprion fabricii]|uniref:calponin homology domain-containing protein DDB_G0272472 n=1 Tax=Neodiprion fabricii TaxID=2872261 RepID=UPI001ED919CF|nr:calponin homology domain-containing protein DDB_G0272472 [Neodiprion fabricii]